MLQSRHFMSESRQTRTPSTTGQHASFTAVDGSLCLQVLPKRLPAILYLPNMRPSTHGGAFLLGGFCVVLVDCRAQPKGERLLRDLFAVKR